MPQVPAAINDFSMDKLTDQGLRLCVSSDSLPYQGMLTEQGDSGNPPPRPFQDRDASVDTGDTIEMPPWLIDVLPRLEQLAALPEDWDSYGSPPPSLKLMWDALVAIQRAERLLRYRQRAERLLRDRQAQPTTMPTPSLVPLSGGGIQIEWQTPLKELELEFFEERGTVALAVDIATGETTEGEFCATDFDTVSHLLAWLMSR